MIQRWWRGDAQRRDWCLLILLPLLLHAPELLGIIKTDPRLFTSGLGVDIGRALVGGQAGYVDPNSAFTTQDFGHLAAEQWLHGTVPWWNPFVGVGAPLAAEMQPAALFLPFVLLLHFQQGWLWLHILMQIISAIGAYTLLRGLGLGRGAALVGAVLYGGNGTLAWFSHGPERVAAFLPWMLHGVELCRARLRGGAVFAVALALSIYAGFPETAYLDGLLALAWAVLRAAQQGGRAWRLVLRLGSGGVAGVLLAMPAIWPFVLYLREGDIGGHAGMAFLALEPPGIAMMLLPYINGPIGALGTRLFVIWGNIGGYLGIVAAVLGIAGAISRGPERGLRLLLFGWLVFGVARTAGLWPAMWLADQIPLVGRTAFFRYIQPSLCMAAAGLAALAIEQWRAAPGPARAFAAGVLGGLLLLGAALLCRPVLSVLWPLRAYRVFFVGSMVWGALLCCLIPALLAVPARAAALAGLWLLVGLDTAGNYLAARLAAPVRGHFDQTPVRFLQAHVGLSRVISTRSGLGLNESAWDGIGAIDETMLPVPGLWARFVHRRLHGDPISFRPLLADGTALQRDWPVLRSLGVGWLVAEPGFGLTDMVSSFGLDGPKRALRLAPDVAADGDLPAGLPGSRPTEHVGIDIGTYGGLADGTLSLALTGRFGAAVGNVALIGAADNGAIDFRLDRTVPLHTPIHWQIVQRHSTYPVAIWLFGAAGVPRLTTAIDRPGVEPEPVFRSVTKEIYRLPDPAPYWDAGPCTATGATRGQARVTCAAPGSLLRRELFYPGWRATVNATPAPIVQSGLFQRVALPAGNATVRFRYAPPGILWATLAGVAGLLATLLLLLAQARPWLNKAPLPAAVPGSVSV